MILYSIYMPDFSIYDFERVFMFCKSKSQKMKKIILAIVCQSVGLLVGRINSSGAASSI